MSSPGTKKDSSQWRRQTLAVRGGQVRSNFSETSEALYLTSGIRLRGSGKGGGPI